MAAVAFKITGLEETIARVMKFEKKLRRKWLLKAGRAGAKPVKAALIRNAPLDKYATPGNTWRKSVGTKVKVYRGGLVLWFAVGPRSAFAVVVTLKAKFYRDQSGRLRKIPRERSQRPEQFQRNQRPGRYSHLAEKKHQMIARTEAQTRSQSAAAMQAVLEEAAADV